MADVLAEAVVELEADVDKANKELKAAFKQMDKDAKEAADNIDKSFKQLSGDLGKEFERAAKEFARQQREQEREAKRVAREIERENLRVQREIEAETKRVQREIELETKRVAKENEKVQKEYEKEFIASQRAMEKEARETQQRQAESMRSHVNALRKFASQRFSLTLGIDTSQLTRALGVASKLGAVLGAVGIGALAGQGALAGLASITLAIQDLVGAVALLPAVGAAAGIVIGTLTIGLKGLGDAIKADSPKELEESLKSLSENGKKFVLTIRDFKDEFENLGKAVQQALLADFNKEAEKLGKALLPVLQKGFVNVAKELNLSAKTLAEFVREGQSIKDLNTVFSNTAKSVGIFRGAIQPAAQAFRDLVAVGSDFLPVIAADLAGLAKRFGDFIAQARDSGELAAFFERAIQAVRDFFGVLGNIAGIFDGVMDAAEQSLGGGFLTLLRTATQNVEDFVNSARGQTALIQFFEGAQEAGKALLPILGDLARLVLEVVLPAFTRIGTEAAPGLQALVTGLRQGLERAIPGIIEFVKSLAQVVETLVDAGVLAALGDLVRVIGEQLGGAIRALAPTFADLVNSILLKLQDILPKIVPAIVKFADAFGDLVIAALPVVDVLAEFVSEVGFPTLQRIAEKLIPIIDKLAKGLNETLLPVLPELGDAFGELVDALAPIADELLTAIVDLLKILAPLLPPIARSVTELVKALTPLVKLFTGLIEFISKVVEKLYEIPGVRKFMEEELPFILALLTGTLIVPLGKLIELIDDVVTRLDEAGVFDIFIEALGFLANALILTSDSFERMRSAFETAWNFIKATAVAAVQFVIDVIITGFNIIQLIFETIWEIIKAIFQGAWEFLKAIVEGAIRVIIAIITGNFAAIPSIIGDAMQRAYDAAKGALDRLIEIIRDLPGKIVSALGDLGGLLYGAGQSIVQGLINGIMSMGGWLQEQARSIANSALQAAKNALGVKSPSTKMMVVGEQFGEGFVIGVDNMLKKAMSVGKELANQTVQSTTTALSPTDNSAFRMTQTLNRLTRNGLGPAPIAPQSAGTTTLPQAPVEINPEVRVFIGNEEINSHISGVVDEKNRQTKRSVIMGARRTV